MRRMPRCRATAHACWPPAPPKQHSTYSRTSCPRATLDQLVVTRRRERLAQSPDVDVDGALLDEHVLAPHFVQEPRAREDANRMGHEKVEQAKLGGPQVDRLVAGADLVGRRV